ncbi:MAG: hypothetical protein GXY34_04720, partial [Syntrophomonadaceae bacterium]|nr:hypothetical protein [Syntrophomonadaceae bacterium]
MNRSKMISCIILMAMIMMLVPGLALGATGEVTGITVSVQPTTMSYVEGQNLDLSALKVTLTYADSTTEDVAFADFAGKGIIANPANGTAMVVATHHDNPVVVSCNGQTANTNNLKVAAKAVSGIAVETQPTKLNYIAGENLDLSG